MRQTDGRKLDHKALEALRIRAVQRVIAKTGGRGAMEGGDLSGDSQRSQKSRCHHLLW